MAFTSLRNPFFPRGCLWNVAVPHVSSQTIPQMEKVECYQLFSAPNAPKAWLDPSLTSSIPYHCSDSVIHRMPVSTQSFQPRPIQKRSPLLQQLLFFFCFFFFFMLYWFIFWFFFTGRGKGRKREEKSWFVIPLIMHSLVDSWMRPDGGVNPYPCPIRMTP